MSSPRPDRSARSARGGLGSPWVTIAASLLVVAALVVLAIGRLDLASVGRALSRVSIGWLIPAVALVVGSFFARAESWFAIVRAAVPDRPIARAPVRRGLLIGMAGSAVAPGRAGEALRAWVVARRLGPSTTVLEVIIGTVIAQTLLNLFALAILAGIASAGAASTALQLGALAAAFGLPAALLAGLFAGPALLRSAARSGSTRLGRIAALIRRQVLSVRLGLRAFRHPRDANHAAGFQLAAWALQLGTCYAVLRAVHADREATIAAAAAVLVAVNLTAIVPLTPSNIGTFQAACIAVLAPFGIGASLALAYGLILQGIEIATSLALGIPAVLREDLSWREMRRGVTNGASTGGIDGGRPLRSWRWRPKPDRPGFPKLRAASLRTLPGDQAGAPGTGVGR